MLIERNEKLVYKGNFSMRNRILPRFSALHELFKFGPWYRDLCFEFLSPRASSSVGEIAVGADRVVFFNFYRVCDRRVSLKIMAHYAAVAMTAVRSEE